MRQPDLRSGIYKVVTRTCPEYRDYALDCPRVRYLELVRGRFYGIEPGDLALVEWLAGRNESDVHTYSARQLRGHLGTRGEYVIADVSNGGDRLREWFVLQGDVPTEYQLEIQSTESGRDERAKMSLVLAPVVRDERLTRMLPYPEAAPQD